jgi:hypothetical protein
MGFATHLGPWLLGTVKNTTGTTAATTRNTGCTTVSQSADVVFGTLTGNAIAIPAGSQINHITVVTTTVFSAATTIKLSIGGVDFTSTGTITNVGAVNLTANSTTPEGWLNVGPADTFITYTMTGAGLTTGAATVQLVYNVRSAAGNQAQPANQQ